MPRISRLSRSQVQPELVPLYDQFLRERGNVPYFFRTFAHRPEIMQTMFAHMNAVLRTGTLPTKLKELAVVRTSQFERHRLLSGQSHGHQPAPRDDGRTARRPPALAGERALHADRESRDRSRRTHHASLA